jgi:hypothetical protein
MMAIGLGQHAHDAVAVVSQFVKDIGPKCITQLEFGKNFQEAS